jgi:2-iminobutanoate/2-iminopropanoate deaminase
MAKVETITRATMESLIGPYGLCEATRVGDLLYIGGQAGIDDQTHEVVAGGLRAQAVQAFKNIKAIIALAGGRPEHLLHMTWYLADGPQPRSMLEDSLDITAARDEVFPGLVTGSTAVRVKGLLTPELLIEIQAVAAL